MSEKQYRLKEEVKKYFLTDGHGNRNAVMTKKEWDDYGVDIEALEEVESKIKVLMFNDNSSSVLEKHSGIRGFWTEQERQDIEDFLNTFGSMEKLYELVNSWDLNEPLTSFRRWLKDKTKVRYD